MNKILFGLLIVLFWGCTPNTPDNQIDEITESGEGNSENEDNNNLQEGQIELDITFELPSESPFLVDDLFAFSFFSERISINDSASRLIVPDTDAYEIVVVNDSAGETFLIGYFNPNSPNTKIDAYSTALSLVMMHPIIADLSVQARTELISSLNSNNSFSELLEGVTNSLKNGQSPLADTILSGRVENVLLETIGADLQKNIFENFETEINPIKLIGLSNGSIRVENSSSMAYSITLNEDESIVLQGVDKTLITLANGWIYEQIFNEDDINKTFYVFNDVGSDGLYNLYADNGFQNLSSITEEVRYYNVGRIAFRILGLLTGIKYDNYSWAVTLGRFLFDKGLTLGGIENSQELIGTIVGVLDAIVSGGDFIVETADNLLRFDNAVIVAGIKQLAKAVTVVNDGVEVGVIAYDAFVRPSSVELCAMLEEGSFTQCEELSTIQELDYGNIPVGEIKSVSSFSIENITKDDIIIEDIFFPNTNFSLVDDQNYSSILSGETKEIFVEFFPLIDEEPAGEIEIFTNLTSNEEDIIKIPISGSFIDPLVLEISGEETSSLDFSEVIVGTSNTKIITLKNVSDYEINILNPLQVNTVVDGFNFPWEWSVLDLPANSVNQLEISFDPLSAQQYSESISFLSNSSQAAVNLSLSGIGIDSFVSATIENNQPDFGEVEINSTSSKRLDITNNSNTEEVTITYIESNSEDFEIDFQGYTPTLGPNESTSVIINFTPSTVGSKLGEIIIDADIAGKFTLQLSGQGVTNNGDILAWLMSSEKRSSKIDNNCSSLIEVTWVGCDGNESSTEGNVCLGRVFDFQFFEDGALVATLGNQPWGNPAFNNGGSATIQYQLDGNTITIIGTQNYSYQSSSTVTADVVLTETWQGTKDPEEDFIILQYSYDITDTHNFPNGCRGIQRSRWNETHRLQ